MKRLNSNVSAAQRALEKRPEVFHSVDVNAPLNVALRLVNEIVNESALQSIVVSNRVIGVYRASKPDVLENFVLQSFPSYVGNNCGANLSKTAVKNTLHYRLDCRSAYESFLGGEAHPARFVHVLYLATNKRFIHFDFISFATDLAPAESFSFHHFADSLQHKPCRRLRHSQSAPEFMRTDTVLRVSQQPECRHPLIKTDRRIFHDRLNFDRELALAGVAKPQLAGLDKRVLGDRATRTHNVAIRPSQFLGKLKAAVGIAKVDDCFLQRFRLWNVLSGVHVENDTTSSHVCQLVYCQYQSLIAPSPI